MLSIGALKNWGADVDEALVRCLNNENFYLMLVQKAVQDQGCDGEPGAYADPETRSGDYGTAQEQNGNGLCAAAQ